VAFSVTDSARGEVGEAPPADPRAALVRALADAVAGANAAGDGKAARVALAALGELVGDGGTGGSVVDLADERRRRG
jgi:hypothetical protein